MSVLFYRNVTRTGSEGSLVCCKNTAKMFYVLI